MRDSSMRSSQLLKPPIVYGRLFRPQTNLKLIVAQSPTNTIEMRAERFELPTFWSGVRRAAIAPCPQWRFELPSLFNIFQNEDSRHWFSEISLNHDVKPVIAQLVEHLTVDICSNQMVPGSIPGDRIIWNVFGDVSFMAWSGIYLAFGVVLDSPSNLAKPLVGHFHAHPN